VKQKYPPTEKDLARHPSMHRTDTLDMFVVAYGEIYLVSDTDETLLKPRELEGSQCDCGLAAAKGLFVTASSFSPGARETAGQLIPPP